MYAVLICLLSSTLYKWAHLKNGIANAERMLKLTVDHFYENENENENGINKKNKSEARKKQKQTTTHIHTQQQSTRNIHNKLWHYSRFISDAFVCH